MPSCTRRDGHNAGAVRTDETRLENRDNENDDAHNVEDRHALGEQMTERHFGIDSFADRIRSTRGGGTRLRLGPDDSLFARSLHVSNTGKRYACCRLGPCDTPPTLLVP